MNLLPLFGPSTRRLTATSCLILVTTAALGPMPCPASAQEVFREFTFSYGASPEKHFAELDPGSKREFSGEFAWAQNKKPNAPKPITLDLAKATRAELSFEYWGGHIGTSGQRFQVDANGWVDLPQPVGTPAEPPRFYRTLHGNNAVAVPLAHLRDGENVVQFAAGPQIAYRFDFGFYWIYDFAVRVYYGADRPHPTGAVLSPQPGATFSDTLELEASASSPNGPITRVEFIGEYDDFDWDGNGVWREWQFTTHHGVLQHHLGTAKSAPWRVQWDARWLPDQTQPVRVRARITDASGLTYLTPPVENLAQKRANRRVTMFKSTDVPQNFSVRDGKTKKCSIVVEGDLTKAKSARLVLSTWSASTDDDSTHELRLNGERLANRFGQFHQYSFDVLDVPLARLKSGANEISLFSTYKGHGLEINWPGPVLVVEYEGNGPSGAISATGGLRLPLDRWTYIEADNSRAKYGDFPMVPKAPKFVRYLGLAMGDLTGDGMKDIVSGRYFYRNPGGDMTGKWERVDFGLNVDACLMVDVDGDEFGDVIAMALPDIYWLEANDRAGNSWTARKVATAPRTDHMNSQGFASGQIVPGGKPEIVLATQEGVFYFEIPTNPAAGGEWRRTLITKDASDEGLALADVDRDGWLDLVAGKNEEYLAWWRNPGNGSGDWMRTIVGTTAPHPVDRVCACDMNGDGRVDFVVTEERYPGKEPDSNLFWFEQPAEPKATNWERHRIFTGYSLNNLDLGDFDQDGDFDIITSEHKGTELKLLLFENDGRGHFTEHILDRGKESHLGTQASDLDGDGDLDLVSIGWDNFKFLHIWRNDAIKPAHASSSTPSPISPPKPNTAQKP